MARRETSLTNFANPHTFVSMNVSPLYNSEMVISSLRASSPGRSGGRAAPDRPGELARRLGHITKERNEHH